MAVREILPRRSATGPISDFGKRDEFAMKSEYSTLSFSMEQVKTMGIHVELRDIKERVDY